MSGMLIAQLLPILHSTDGGGTGTALLLLAGPIAGTALYAGIYRYYRNADKTDAFERETRIELKTAITGGEQQIDEIRGTRERRIKGDNTSDYRSRVAELE